MSDKQNLIQKQAFNAWINSNCRGRIIAGTGSGKSKIGIMAAEYISKSNKKAKIAIIVPTEQLRDNGWKDEFVKWKLKKLYDKADKFCYASISKIEGNVYDLVILDEAHYLTVNNYKFFNQNDVKSIISLTATEPDDKDKLLLLNSLGLKVFEYKLKDGVEDGVIAPFKIKVIEFLLDDTDKCIKAGTKAKPFLTTEKAHYDYLTKQFQRAQFFQNKPEIAKFAALARMIFIYNLPSKTKVAKEIIDTLLVNNKSLVFCGSIKQSEELCDNVFHFKTDDSALIAFKNDKIKLLGCVNSLNEGHNIPNMDSALIVQLNSKELKSIQRIGRVVRYREGHEAIIYILSVIGTVDETWTKKALQGFDPKVIEYINYKNLKLTK